MPNRYCTFCEAHVHSSLIIHESDCPINKERENFEEVLSDCIAWPVLGSDYPTLSIHTDGNYPSWLEEKSELVASVILRRKFGELF